MLQVSPDQTQWFHLYRVKAVYPITFVLLACEESNAPDNLYRLLELRILCNDEIMAGGSWCVRSNGKDVRNYSRADAAKFLEQHAKFAIASAVQRGLDEIEFIESSREELAVVASLDERFRKNLEAVVPTLLPKYARFLIKEATVNQTGLEFEELPDWRNREADQAP
ncbi:MAG: hypothetical protein LV481_01480 [Methylacidiphilales bacterium]|nr:hypothetical protein [Candidatus Methylacidiphilales bacterium]